MLELRRRARRIPVALGHHLRPSFLVIGAQKAGTTSLARYLEEHPGVRRPAVKEIAYFNVDARYRKGPGFYHSHFPLPLQVPRGTLTFEATPDYLPDPRCPDRVHAYDPDMKLIVMLRDPVDRAYSAWNMFRRFQDYARFAHLGDDRTFDRAVTDELARMERGVLDPEPGGPNHLRYGLYARQLRRWLERFGQDRLLILESRDLKRDHQGTLNRVARFVSLPVIDWPKSEESSFNVGEYQERMTDAMRERLRELYAPHDEELGQLLGAPPSWRASKR